jgi:glutathione S-transferase
VSLRLYYHPLASYCWKVLSALYENETPFEPELVDLSNPTAAAAFKRIWPIGKFPVLRDEARDQTIPESSIIIEYLARYFPGKLELVPTDPDRAREARLYDRFYDAYVHEQMQTIVGDKLRPDNAKDAHGVAHARAQLATSYAWIDEHMREKEWALGDAFSLADCAASPALYYANLVAPIGAQHQHTRAYLDRLTRRPAFARVLAEAQPYFAMFPG